MKIYALGIDLGKTVFHLVGLDSGGQVVVRKRCSRTQLLAFTANLEVQLIGMEACSGAHFLGKALRGCAGNMVLCGSVPGSRMGRSLCRTDGHIISRRENSLTTAPFSICSIIVENRD